MKLRRDPFILFTILFILTLLPIFFGDNSYIMHILIICLVWAMLATSWDLVMGYAGVFTFGQFAFFAIGAYVTGVLTARFGMSPWIGILIGGIGAGLVSTIIGILCLRLRGVYISLVTFGLHLVLIPLIKAVPKFTGGVVGLIGIPSPTLGGYTFTSLEKIPWYYLMLTISFLSFFVIYKITHSSIGLAFIALRDAEPFAKSLGIDDYKYKLMVFAISASLAGITGAFYAHYVSTISTRMLGLDTFLLVFVMVIVGGLGRFPGALVVAFLITFANELLRPLEVYRPVLFGVIVILAIIFMPKGLMEILDVVSPHISLTFQRIRNRISGLRRG